MSKPGADSPHPHGSERYDIILRAAYAPTAAWLYNVIDAAIWLGRGCTTCDSGRPVRIRVVLIPLRPRADLKRARAAAGRYALGWWPDRWRDRLKKAVSRRWSTRLDRAFEKRATTGSLYHRIQRAETVRITHGRYELIVEPLGQTWLESARLWLKSRSRARALWAGCFDNGTFVVTRFLALRYGPVRIGDLAASSTLKSVPSLEGSLRPCRQLFRSLVTAVYICELCDTFRLDDRADEYVLAAEPSYLDSVVKRALHAKRASILEPTCYLDRYEVIAGDEQYRNPWLAKPSESPVTDPDGVEAHLRGRLFEPGTYLWYMSEGANDNRAPSLRDRHGNLINDFGALAVTVFLHSFDDGQYFFGLDGFDDIFEWTTFTIDRCLANPAVDRVFVKDHPGAQHSRFAGHAMAVRRLQKMYSSESRVTFLQSTSSLVGLCDATRFFGITHHGSVAEEIVFLGQPMIGSVWAPWESHYPFLSVWRSIAEYGEILDGLSPQSWRPPTTQEREALFRYIQEYRLSTLPTEELDPWLKFARIMGDERTESTYERFLVHNRALEQLGTEDSGFDAFLCAMDTDSRIPRPGGRREMGPNWPSHGS